VEPYLIALGAAFTAGAIGASLKRVVIARSRPNRRDDLLYVVQVSPNADSARRSPRAG
jgi:hypothetical protein